MYALVQQSGHVVWKEWWYALMLIFSLRANLYITQKTKSLLLMWWLLTWYGKQWLRMSLVNKQVQLLNLAPLLISTSIKGFMRGTTLFRRPWRCTLHLGGIWIISSSVPIFSTIGNWKVIYPYLFKFNFLGNLLVLLFNMFLPLL
jgi:hypothetical protein